MVKERNSYFDFLRGLAIIMVVGIHTFPHHNGFNSLGVEFNVFIRQIINCAVPIFLAISGFFVSQKVFTNRQDYLFFWEHQIPKVYIPALVWGLPWLILSIKGGGGIFINVILWLICGLSVLYYIALIIQCYLLLPIIQKITPSRYQWKVVISIAAILTVLATAIVIWTRSICGIRIPLIAFAGPFPLWILYFVLGVYLAKTNRDYRISWLVVFVILSLLLQMIEAHFLNTFHGVGDDIKFSWILYSVCVILLLFSKRIEGSFNNNFFINRMVTKIGVSSFGIYLTHYLVRNVFYHIVTCRFWPLDWFSIIFLDIMFIIVMQKVLPKSTYKYLGI